MSNYDLGWGVLKLNNQKYKIQSAMLHEGIRIQSDHYKSLNRKIMDNGKRYSHF